MNSIPQFFIYVLSNSLDQIPFYVGKEKEEGRRQRDHESEARGTHHCHRCHKIRQIWNQGGVILRETAYTTDSEQDAYTEEKRLIAFYGRDLLTNATDGGEGQCGRTGELSGAAKLTWAKVAEIRRRYAEETVTTNVLALEHGVSIIAIEHVLAQKTWKTGEPPIRRDPATRIANSPKGEQQQDAKLTWELVREIRALYPASGTPTDVIAEYYGVSQRVIYLVLCNKGWHDPSYDASVYMPVKPRAAGERNHGAVLTWAIVREIRARYVFRKVTAKMLAAEYGISSTHVEKIIRREMWHE